MSRNVEDLQPYKLCEFLDRGRPATFSMLEIATGLGMSKSGVESILRKLVHDKIVFMSGIRRPDVGKARFTYSTDGNATAIFAAYRDRVEKEKAAAAAGGAAAPKLTQSYIMAALHAHPLHSWRGVRGTPG